MYLSIIHFLHPLVPELRVGGVIWSLFQQSKGEIRKTHWMSPFLAFAKPHRTQITFLMDVETECGLYSNDFIITLLISGM